MDRFIVMEFAIQNSKFENLKSSMDRFIAKSKFGVESVDLSFKIQYG